MKLNLGSGKQRKEGFLSVDVSHYVGADIVCDLKQYSWPFDNDSVEEIHCAHFIEHLDGIERMEFFNECWRVLKLEAIMTCITPGAFTSRYMQDPTHKFPMVVWEFYNYLNEKARIEALLEHYPLTCNFEFVGHHEINPTNIDSKFSERHLLNSINDLHVVLTKKPKLGI